MNNGLVPTDWGAFFLAAAIAGTVSQRLARARPGRDGSAPSMPPRGGVARAAEAILLPTDRRVGGDRRAVAGGSTHARRCRHRRGRARRVAGRDQPADPGWPRGRPVPRQSDAGAGRVRATHHARRPSWRARSWRSESVPGSIRCCSARVPAWSARPFLGGPAPARPGPRAAAATAAARRPDRHGPHRHRRRRPRPAARPVDAATTDTSRIDLPR